MGRKADLLIKLGLHRSIIQKWTNKQVEAEWAEIKKKKLKVAEILAYFKDAVYGTDTQADPKVDKLNKIYHEFKDQFVGEFHDVLWQVIIARTDDFENCCFTVNVTDHGNCLGIAEHRRKGYVPTNAFFNDKQYDKAMKVLDRLNEAVFTLDKREAIELICTTM